MTNPIENPTIYDKIILGGITSPGLCEITSGGDREMTVNIQGQPGYQGKVAVYTGEELMSITYRFTIWTKKSFDKWKDVFLPMLDRARKAKPRPEVLTLEDARLQGLGVNAVTVKKISKQITLGPGKFAYEVEVLEWKEPIPIPRLPPNAAVQGKVQTAADREAAALQIAQQNKDKARAGFNKAGAPKAKAFQAGLSGAG